MTGFSRRDFTKAFGIGAIGAGISLPVVAQAPSAMVGYANIKDFGALGDGSTDNSNAIQAWLTHIIENSLVGLVPPGNYKVTRSIIGGQGSHWGIVGYGRYLSAFFYAETQALNIFEIGVTSANSSAVHIKGISIFSYYEMSGGFALKANRLANSTISDVTFGGELYATNVSNGVWLNGAHQVFLTDFDIQTKGDGIRVNGIDNQSCSDLYLDHGFSTNNGICGIRCAGSFGGLYIDEVETLANGFANLIIDSSQNSPAIGGNREIILGTSYISDGVHSVSDYGVYIDDPAANGGTVVCHGFIGSSVYHGVYVKSWPNSSFCMAAGRIFNNLGDGLLVDDTTAEIVIGEGVSIDNNGGWGVRSSGINAGSRVSGAFRKNNLGDISQGISSWMQHQVVPFSQSGIFSSAICSIRWIANGKTINFSGEVLISQNGSASGSVGVLLPYHAYPGTTYICSGRADSISGKALQGVINGQYLNLVAYDNSYPGSSGETLCFSGFYEADFTTLNYA